MPETVIQSVFTVILIIMAIVLLICMFKAIKGPRVADRVVCVNMMGTVVIVIIAILALKMKEGYLADISIIYAMVSFLAVVVLCKIYMGVYLEKQDRKTVSNSENKADNSAMDMTKTAEKEEE